MNADPIALGLSQLRQDPQFFRIPAGRHGALVDAALEDGFQLADEIVAQHGDRPDVIAALHGIAVEFSDREAGYGSVIVHAEYVARPPAITLYQPAIRRLARCARGNGVQLGPDGIEYLLRLLIAHELYHHFDCQRGCEQLTRRHRVNILDFGRWQWTSGLSSLAEIAAGAFAQRMLDLPFHPSLLDSMLSKDNQS